MNKNITFWFLVILFSFGLMVANTHATVSLPMVWDRQQEFSDIVRTFVMNPQGQYLGRINDLVFNNEGHVVFAILARPGALGMSGRPVAIPFKALSRKDGERHFTLDMSWERLENSPLFTKGDLGDRKWATDIYRYFGLQPYWTEEGPKKERGPAMDREEPMPMTNGWDRPYEVSEILGTHVTNSTGDYLGRINNLVIDPEGRISFFVLATGGFLRIGEKYFAVPFTALSYDPEPKHLIFEVSIEGLGSAPAFSRSTLGDREWAEDVYRYFGQQPYWTEGGPGKK